MVLPPCTVKNTAKRLIPFRCGLIFIPASDRDVEGFPHAPTQNYSNKRANSGEQATNNREQIKKKKVLFSLLFVPLTILPDT
jgi:hypothetical protein